MITGSDLQPITNETISNTDKLLLRLSEIRKDCSPLPLLTVVDATPPPSRVVDASPVSWAGCCNGTDDEITEKRAAIRAATIEYQRSDALYQDVPADWLSFLKNVPQRAEITRYTHPIRNASLYDVIECGIISHGRVPKEMELSEFALSYLAIFGHSRVYHRSTGDIALKRREDLDENTVVLSGSAAQAQDLAEQPTVETPALPPLDVRVRRPTAA